MRFRVCYANCAKWEDRRDRWPKLIGLLEEQSASVYLLTEAPAEFVRDFAMHLGWAASKGDDTGDTGPNRNSVVWNPEKWWFRRSVSVSLSQTEGDVADGKTRTVLWVQLVQRDSGLPIWLGTSHLSPNAGRPYAEANAERVSQAEAIVAGIPGTPVVLGIDRNCNPGSDPERALACGMTLATPDLGDTFTGRAGEQTLDGLYMLGPVEFRWVEKIHPGGATDHYLLRAGFTITEGVSSL